MRREAKYSHEELKQMFLDKEKEIGRTPMSTEFVIVGLPDIGYYKRAFGNYNSFLEILGRKVQKKIYRRKNDPKRFFYPQEWMKLMNSIKNEDHKFWFELMLHTGARIDEIRNIKVEHINFDKEHIFLAKPKGGRGRERTIQISTYLRNRIANYVKNNNLKDTDTLFLNRKDKPVTTSGVNKELKKACEAAGIKDWKDFSCHNIRKTTEMWLISLNINHLAIIAHIGHGLEVARTYYVSTQLFTTEDKALIKSILDNLLQK